MATVYELTQQAGKFFEQLQKLAEKNEFSGPFIDEKEYVKFQIKLGLAIPTMTSGMRELLLAQAETLESVITSMETIRFRSKHGS